MESRRFQVRRELGKGALGLVYEALDTETQALVALKVLREASLEHLHSLKSEFRKLCDVRHPNLVQMGELHFEGGTCFLTMEVVRGSDYRTYVTGAGERSTTSTSDAQSHPTSNGHPPSRHDTGALEAQVEREGTRAQRFDETRLRHALRQLAEAVAALHAAGLVHRDLKHSNVLVENGGRVVVLDFGLAQSIDPDGLREVDDDGMLGTAAFMAPEQVCGEPVGPASDWYAVGVMLFDVLVGRLPFVGSTLTMMESKCSQDAPRPAELVDGCPEDLDALCAALLARDPALRPSGADVLARLAAHPVALPRVGARAFVGREAELGILTSALEQVRSGRFAALLVEGEPGVGKTELVDQFFAAHVLRQSGIVLLRGRCYEQEFIPFKGIDALVDELVVHLLRLDESDLSAMLPARLGALTALFPALYRVPAVASMVPPPSALEPNVEQRAQAFAELASLLNAIASRSVLILFIDDLQWAGSDSEALLQALFRRDAPPVLLIATRRTTDSWDKTSLALVEPDAEHEFHALFRRVRVKGLSTEESAKLVRELWPTLGSGSEGELGSLLTEAGGHPLFLRELASRASRTGTMHGELRLDEMLRERIVSLPREARALLEVCAIGGAPLPARILGRVAGTSHAETARALSLLRSEQLVRTHGNGERRRVEPFHDRVREAVVDGIAGGSYTLSAADTLANVHLTLAHQLLDALVKQEFETPATVVAMHFNLGADAMATQAERRLALEQNMAALKQAKLATVLDSAQHYLARARSHLIHLEDDERQRLARELDFQEMELAHLLRDSSRVETLFRKLVREGRDDEERAAAYAAKVRLDAARSDLHSAIATASQGLLALDCPVPTKSSKLLLLLELIRLEWSLRGRDLPSVLALSVSSDTRDRARMMILMAMTVPAFFSDPELMAMVSMRMARLSLTHGLTDLSSFGFAGYAAALGNLRKYQRSYEFGQLARALLERFPNPALVAKVEMLSHCVTTIHLRPFQEILDVLRRITQLGLANGDLSFRTYAAILLPSATLCAGHTLLHVKRECGDALRIARQDAQVDMAAQVEWRQRAVRCFEGENPDPLMLDGAESSEGAFFQEMRSQGCVTAELVLSQMKTYLSYHFGEPEQALAHAARANAKGRVQAGHIDLCFYQALAACACMERASVLGRLRLRALVRTNLKKITLWAECCPGNFAGRATLVLGELARARGQHEKAGVLLERARDELLRSSMDSQAGIAWQSLATLHARRGKQLEAQACVKGAIEAYQRWGATALVRFLQRQH